MLLVQGLWLAQNGGEHSLVPTSLEAGDIVDIGEVPKIGNGIFVTRKVTTTELSDASFVYKPLWFECVDVAGLDENTDRSVGKRTPYLKVLDQARVVDTIALLAAGANLQLSCIKDGGGRYLLVKRRAAANVGSIKQGLMIRVATNSEHSGSKTAAAAGD